MWKTIEEARKELLDYAAWQVGYTPGVHNKYAAIVGDLYGWDVDGAPWCDVFVDACFIAVFGMELGCKLVCQHWHCNGAACRYSAAYYRDAGRLVHDPEPGDQIFYYAGGDINHTGLVTEVTENTVKTIEGNWGNRVCKREISKYAADIAGYGRPCWELVVGEEVQSIAEKEYVPQPGEIVKVKPNAHWYNGEPIPDFVFWTNWIVHSVTGDRVVINESTDGTRAIMSPIAARYLEPINKEEAEQKEEGSDVVEAAPREEATEAEPGKAEEEANIIKSFLTTFRKIIIKLWR